MWKGRYYIRSKFGRGEERRKGYGTREGGKGGRKREREMK